jgi:hypothetical protein
MIRQEQTIGWKRLFVSLTINVMVATFVLLLLRSNKFLTREQLAEIQMGMTLAETQARLGSGRDSAEFHMQLGIFSDSSGQLRLVTRNPWDPTFVVPINSSEMIGIIQQSAGHGRFWIGRDHLLWVFPDNDNRVRRAWLLPYREEGGGIRNWAKHQYESWFPDPAPVMPALPLPTPAPSKPES